MSKLATLVPTSAQLDRTAHHDWAATVRHLDAIGFDAGNYRISIYRALLLAVVTLVVVTLGRLGMLLTRRSFNRMAGLDPSQRVLGQKLANLVLWIVLGLAGIDFLGISLTAFTVFTGAFGLAIGFGLQKTFGNLISGIILLADRSIKPGDVIAVGDGARRTVGQVERIGIRAVSVTTRDRIEYLIPNEQLMTATVENWSFSSREVRIKVPLQLPYGTDLVLAEKIMLDEARKLPRRLGQSEPTVWLIAFGEKAVEFEVQVWIDDPEDGLGNLRSDLLKALWHAFAAQGIAIAPANTGKQPGL